MSCMNLFSPQKHKATPILTFPRQTGEGTELLINQRDTTLLDNIIFTFNLQTIDLHNI